MDGLPEVYVTEFFPVVFVRIKKIPRVGGWDQLLWVGPGMLKNMGFLLNKIQVTLRKVQNFQKKSKKSLKILKPLVFFGRTQHEVLDVPSNICFSNSADHFGSLYYFIDFCEIQHGQFRQNNHCFYLKGDTFSKA